MTNYKDLVLKIHPTAECKKMVSVINRTQYYILVPNDLDAIPMRVKKTEEQAWEFAYNNSYKPSPYVEPVERIKKEETVQKEHPWNAKRLKHNPPFIKIL